MTDFKKLKVVELRAELAARGLPQAGKRDELIERLEEHEFQHAEPSHDDNDNEMVVDEEIVDTPAENVNTLPVAPVKTPEVHHPVISPVIPPTEPEPTAIQDAAAEQQRAIEEEKRRLRALRFGIDETEAAQVKIEVAIKRLDHALPNRSRHHHHHHRKKHSHSHSHSHAHRQISINKP